MNDYLSGVALEDKPRKGDWILTFTNRRVWTIDPRVSEISIIDIAHALAMSCRYTGHGVNFYSVAEHSCHLFDNCSEQNRFWALMHDGSEGYISDINRPTKPHITGYREIEDSLMKVICLRFGLGPVMPSEVMDIDLRICKDEMYQNLQGFDMGGDRVKALGVTLQYWEPRKAEIEFLGRFYSVYKAKGGINDPTYDEALAILDEIYDK